MQGIYTYIPETNYVPREYSVAAILLLLFMVLISLVPVLNLLYSYISTFRSMCAVPNMAVFWSSLTSCFPGMLLTYFLNYFEIVWMSLKIIIIIIIIIIITAFREDHYLPKKDQPDALFLIYFHNLFSTCFEYSNYSSSEGSYCMCSISYRVFALASC